MFSLHRHNPPKKLHLLPDDREEQRLNVGGEVPASAVLMRNSTGRKSGAHTLQGEQKLVQASMRPRPGSRA